MSLEGALFCIENPLLDISVEVDAAYLEKYGLDANSAILAEEKHFAIYEEVVQKYKVQYIAGGSTQNTARVAQWMTPQANAVTFVGCVGKDENGRHLKECAHADGVRAEYLEDEKVATGVCAVLITGKHRSMVTNLLAANEYKIAHLERTDIWSLVEKATCFYIGGFFLTVSPPSIMKLAQHAAENNKLFCMNLSAIFISQFFKEPLVASSPYWDVLFGNDDEASTFAKALNWETTDILEIAVKITQLPKVNTKRQRVVVITRGAHGTIVAHDGVAKEHPILKIAPEKIVDTNGAGDAFVGGFLSQLIQEKPIEHCLKGGHFSASVIIQHPGCTFPKEKPNFQ